MKVRSGATGHGRPRHGSRRVARSRRRARLRQLRHDDARHLRHPRRTTDAHRCSPAMRRCGPGRWGASSSRSARWARRSTAAPTGRAHRSRSGAARCTACGTSCRSRRRQVKSALLLAGLQADGVTEVVSPAVTRDHTERMLAALGAPIEVDGLLACASGPARSSRSSSTCRAIPRRPRSSSLPRRSHPARRS